MKMLVLPIILAVATQAQAQAQAQIEPIASANDPGLLDLNYSASQPMHLIVPRGGDLTVSLADEEIPRSVSVGAPAIWQVILASPPNGFVVHAAPGAIDSTLSVLTDKRTYNFRLTTAPATRAPYLIRMTYLADASTAGPPTSSPPVETRARYRLTGNRELRPVAMTDDGSKTYIEWDRDQALPAVFALDRLKREEMVNGYMRDDVFTIDRVYEKLVFRIDRAVAFATRFNAGKTR